MLTPLELDIMKAVWQRPQATVKDVQVSIRPRRKLAYTTVMTLMHRLFLKGFLTRTLRARAHIYEPAVGYNEVRDAELVRLIDNFFEGSERNLTAFLGGEPIDTPTPRPMFVPRADLDESLL